MRKRFTKIICAAIATISAFSLVIAPACNNYKRTGVDKDTTADNVSSNGGFLVETGDYVYFVNGVASNTDDNTFGEVVKGSIQRLAKSDIEEGNYRNSQTIVPLVVYSGSHDAGIYIYDDYIYYTTPTIEMNADGEVLNSQLDFKRTSLDGSETMSDYFWQSTDNTVDYRYVEVDGTVYILYAISESLYGSTTTNIHSVNCETKENTLLAYNVSEYVFDTADAENPYVYYTMGVTQYLGSSNSISMSYNQLYRVRADATESPREYDFSYVTDYDAEEDPLYVNLGDFVFDGIGKTQIETEGRLTQFNFAWGKDTEYKINNSEYKYSLKSYEDGVLIFTRTSSTGSTTGNSYRLTDETIPTAADGRIEDSWDAIYANSTLTPLLYGSDTNTYEYVEINGKLCAILAGSDGITVGEVVNGVVENSFRLSDDASATILDIREEQNSATESHLYMYYSLTGGNGYTLYRIAIDGDSDDYNKLSEESTWDATWTYRGIRILDLDIASGWFMPEFVGNTLFFASETDNMSDYNYIMACDLGTDSGYMMTNSQINDLNEKFEEVNDKIYDYNDETNADGSAAYQYLSDALKYLYFTRDEGYLDELIQAYVDILDKSEEYLYSTRSAEIYHEFYDVEEDWAGYADDYKMINGEKITANFADYYYTVAGVMSEDDEEALRESYRSEYMQAYPTDDSTWWEKLSTVSKVFFIIGMCVAGLAVIAGVTVLTIWLVRRHRNRPSREERKMFVDITDDKELDVYGEDDNN